MASRPISPVPSAWTAGATEQARSADGGDWPVFAAGGAAAQTLAQTAAPLAGNGFRLEPDIPRFLWTMMHARCINAPTVAALAPSPSVAMVSCQSDSVAKTRICVTTT